MKQTVTTRKTASRKGRANDDAVPLTQADMNRMRITPRTVTIRRALGLTQRAFARRYQIALGTLRDWEQGRYEPDPMARNYLLLIARAPAEVARILNGDSTRSRKVRAPRESQVPRL